MASSNWQALQGLLAGAERLKLCWDPMLTFQWQIFPWGSISWPDLFNDFINDLDIDIEGVTGKFADDAKLGGNVDLLRVERHRDPDKLKLGKYQQY